MIYNSKSEGNYAFHIRTDPTGKKHDFIAVLPIAYSNTPLMKKLMETDNIGYFNVTAPDGSDYLFLCDWNYERPYPSVLIFRVIHRGSDIIINDVEQNDLQAAYYAIDNFLN